MVEGSQGDNITTFGGRKEVIARKLQDAVFRELRAEVQFILSVEEFIIAMLKFYGKPEPPPGPFYHDRCLRSLTPARGKFLATCGRYILKIGAELAEAARKATARRTSLCRTSLLDAACKGKFSKMETLFRVKLLAQLLYTDESLPQA